ELQETLEPRRRMLGALALVAVRKEQREPAEPAPLRLARADELIDNDLGAVREVAELRFPEHERVGRRRAVAILEAEHGLFREQRVGDDECLLVGDDVLERYEGTAVLLVDQRGVTMEERAAAAV